MKNAKFHGNPTAICRPVLKPASSSSDERASEFGPKQAILYAGRQLLSKKL